MEEKKNLYKSFMTKDLIAGAIALIALIAVMFASKCHLDLPISIAGVVVVIGCTCLLAGLNKKFRGSEGEK